MKKKELILKATFCCLILSLSNFSYGYLPMKVTSDIRNFIGTWDNIDKKAKGIKKLVIFSQQKKSKIHVYATCKEKTCDWGVLNAKGFTVRYTDNVTPARYIKATYETCITRRNMEIRMDDKFLYVNTHVAYIDNSRRQSHFTKNKFVRVKNSIEKTPPSSKAKLTAEQQKEKCIAEGKLSPVAKLTPEELKEKRLKEWYAAHPKKKTPQSIIAKNLPEECGFGSIYYGKVKYHKGYKVYYLQGRRQLSPNEKIKVQLITRGFNVIGLLEKYVIIRGGLIVGGRSLPGFSRRISGIQLLQVVKDHKVNYKAVKQECNIFHKAEFES